MLIIFLLTVVFTIDSCWFRKGWGEVTTMYDDDYSPFYTIFYCIKTSLCSFIPKLSFARNSEAADKYRVYAPFSRLKSILCYISIFFKITCQKMFYWVILYVSKWFRNKSITTFEAYHEVVIFGRHLCVVSWCTLPFCFVSAECKHFNLVVNITILQFG